MTDDRSRTDAGRLLKPLRKSLVLFVFASMAAAGTVEISSGHEPSPAIMAIIIDDLGHRYLDGLRAVQLPGQVTCSVLPKTPFGRKLAIRAHELGKQVMLHLPLEAEFGEELEPGGISLDTSQQAMQEIVLDDLDWLPFVAGVNNHRGSLLTRHPGHMRWLMGILASRDLFFVDSRTTPHTVALQVAREQAVSATERDIFLDHELNEDAIRQALTRAIGMALQEGSVVVIAHPHPLTMEILEEAIPALLRKGVRLSSVPEVIRYREGRELARQQTLAETARELASPDPHIKSANP
ncbi:MAG: divergent polysaccharide deacetylase family protein [Proteobacteria bacterium]|nr:divergent polysaccharide deacetylase family protein [Pseudomonadota bacterium]